MRTLLLLAGTIVLTACGSTAGTTGSRSASAPVRAGTTAADDQQVPLDRRFQVLGNFVCRTVRTGAPGALRTVATRRKLVAHAAAAAVPAQRTAVSLDRLAAETSHRTALAPLVGAYRSLARLYRAALAPRLGGAESFSVARVIVETEQLAGDTARSLGLPACAPAPAAP